MLILYLLSLVFIDHHYSIYEDDFHNPNSSITDIIMWSKLKEEIHLYDNVDTITSYKIL